VKVIDLFAGVGGLSLGFKQAGFEVVYANEYQQEIARAYELNHAGVIVDTRDIREIDFDRTFAPFKDCVDVVVGGPPCQGFSQKGKRIGLRDERNFMFRKFFEVVRVVEPEFVVIENVPNIISAIGGHFDAEIRDEFEKLGYDVQRRVMKAENFGIPQTRRRAVYLARRGARAPNLPDSNGQKVTVGYPGIAKVCNRCYLSGHLRRDCNNQKRDWVVFIIDLVESLELNPQLVGTWKNAIQRWRDANKY
jgi:DNA (cytosine-5)-methyltransferase 1